MIKRNLMRNVAAGALAVLLAVQVPVPVTADEGTETDSFEISDITENPDSSGDTVPDGEEQDSIPGETDGWENPEIPAPGALEESKEALPVETAISVSGEAGNLILVLTVTNGTFINENIPDFKTVFAEIPEGVTVDVAGQTENTVTFHIFGNVVHYTKSDLHMTIPANWLRDTAEEVVQSETKIEGHDLYWCAHADFGIRLKSKADTITNEEFIKQQNLTENKADYDRNHFAFRKMEFKRFTDETEILEYPAEDARVVGKASKDQSVYEIVGIKDGWVYIESGRVRGFVKKEEIAEPEEKQTLRKYNTARVVIPAAENKACDYVRITGYDYVLKEIPRITLKELDIKEEKDTDSKTVGKLPANGLVFWLASETKGWVYVESEEVRGFVEEKDLLSVRESSEQLEQNGKDAYAFAEKTVEPEENKAQNYKLLSTKQGSMEAFFRAQIVEYANNYIGNPYVYGGTDPVNGIDCSGFMQYLFGTYGIALPRTSASQAFAGKMIPMDNVDQGDLIIYADDAAIYHVVLAAGDGKTVEAANETEGIIAKDVNTERAVWGVSLLDDPESLTMPKEIEKPSYEYEKRVIEKEAASAMQADNAYKEG